MPHLAIPEGPRVRWGDRRRSRVHLTHSLKISADSIRFTLDLPRSCFADFETGMSTMQLLASVMLNGEPRLRRTGGPIKFAARLPSDPPLRVKIMFKRADLPSLRKALRAWRETWSDDSPSDALASHLYSRCFPKVAGLITTPPRRNGIEQRRVTGYIAAALRAVHTIVAAIIPLGRSKDERIQERTAAVQDRIEAICEEHRDIHTYCAVALTQGWNVEQALVVGLVHRAFEGAWEATNHRGLIYRANADVALLRKLGKRVPSAIPANLFRDPRDVYRQYLYRNRTLSEHLLKMKRDRPHLVPLYVEWAEQAFLGKPGAAARYYRLIP